jgi:phospholipid/cholesterol/gamma-HCH transport system substrate-binding protein
MSNASQSEKRIAIRAGLFITLALAVFALVILLLGKERHLFDPQVRYHAAFENVEGLKRDAPVWLGGLEVGHVEAISFSSDLGDKRIQVQLQIARRYADRIRSDSVARIASRGVLGDKAVDVSLGTVTAPPIEPGGQITSGSSGDLASLLKSGGEIVDNAVAISRDVRRAVESYTNPELSQDVTKMVKSASSILGAIEHGDGALHAVIYDPKSGQDVKALIAHAGETAKHVDAALDNVNRLLSDVRTGDGALHALIYDPNGAKAVGQLGRASDELATLIHDARTSENGAVHQLVYGDASGMFANLGQASADLKKITSTIAEGKGSLGGLINDPTVYEDLRTLIGDVKRNRVLRSLVRWSISNNDQLEDTGKPTSPNAKTP